MRNSFDGRNSRRQCERRSCCEIAKSCNITTCDVTRFWGLGDPGPLFDWRLFMSKTLDKLLALAESQTGYTENLPFMQIKRDIE